MMVVHTMLWVLAHIPTAPCHGKAVSVKYACHLGRALVNFLAVALPLMVLHSGSSEALAPFKKPSQVKFKRCSFFGSWIWQALARSAPPTSQGSCEEQKKKGIEQYVFSPELFGERNGWTIYLCIKLTASAHGRVGRMKSETVFWSVCEADADDHFATHTSLKGNKNCPFTWGYTATKHAMVKHHLVKGHQYLPFGRLKCGPNPTGNICWTGALLG